jgi:glycerol-3-phosphate dehydrogenase subunit B
VRDVVVVGCGPAGLMAAWAARQSGARVKVLAAGIGSTLIAPGWLRLIDTDGEVPPALQAWADGHPDHPYALTGFAVLWKAIANLRELCAQAGVPLAGDGQTNFRLPTALGAVRQAALVPESFAAGDVRRPGTMLIAGPAGWRDFSPRLCAGNLCRQGHAARPATFSMPRSGAARFDPTSSDLARWFDDPDVRASVGRQLRPQAAECARVGVPAILGLEHSHDAWLDLQDHLGVPVFEIPTLPPSVPGMRLHRLLKSALAGAGVPIWLDGSWHRRDTRSIWPACEQTIGWSRSTPQARSRSRPSRSPGDFWQGAIHSWRDRRRACAWPPATWPARSRVGRDSTPSAWRTRPQQ